MLQAGLTVLTCVMKWLMGARFAQASPFLMAISNLSTSLLSIAASSSRSTCSTNHCTTLAHN